MSSYSNVDGTLNNRYILHSFQYTPSSYQNICNQKYVPGILHCIHYSTRHFARFFWVICNYIFAILDSFTKCCNSFKIYIHVSTYIHWIPGYWIKTPHILIYLISYSYVYAVLFTIEEAIKYFHGSFTNITNTVWLLYYVWQKTSIQNGLLFLRIFHNNIHSRFWSTV